MERNRGPRHRKVDKYELLEHDIVERMPIRLPLARRAGMPRHRCPELAGNPRNTRPGLALRLPRYITCTCTVLTIHHDHEHNFNCRPGRPRAYVHPRPPRMQAIPALISIPVSLLKYVQWHCHWVMLAIASGIDIDIDTKS